MSQLKAFYFDVVIKDVFKCKHFPQISHLKNLFHYEICIKKLVFFTDITFENLFHHKMTNYECKATFSIIITFNRLVPSRNKKICMQRLIFFTTRAYKSFSIVNYENMSSKVTTCHKCHNWKTFAFMW